MAKRKTPPTIHTRCQAMNAAIREGVIVQANIRGEMQILIGVKNDSLGVNLLFHNEERNLVLFSVAPEAPLEFLVNIPREEEISYE